MKEVVIFKFGVIGKDVKSMWLQYLSKKKKKKKGIWKESLLIASSSPNVINMKICVDFKINLLVGFFLKNFFAGGVI